ncbi:MAG: aldehyde dehydrogenase family protein, partial [Gemmatimonadetes bacterium]|nr:aldehyde dehydrogenase family protein [Gemmatimonadota bacterium]
MKNYIAGKWIDKAEKIEVLNPYDGSIIDMVPKADSQDVERALASAVRGAAVMASLSAYERYEILHRAAYMLQDRQEEFGRLITLAAGKVIAEGRAEAARAVQTLMLSAEEAKRIGGETLPMDAAPGAAGKFGLTIRVPCGVVLAISPFNFPLNLVCHKVGPALAAGNSVIVKPASDTPLSA